MIHHMQLQPKPFELIKNETKTIEIRLNDEKRRKIKIGDEIVFSLADKPSQILKTRVVNLYRFKTFKDLFEAFPPRALGAKNKKDLAGVYKYYSIEQEKKFGVLGIELKVCYQVSEFS